MKSNPDSSMLSHRSQPDRSKNSRQRHFGAEILSLLIPEQHPMIMVDRIIDYRSSPLPQLHAERYISANEPVLVGHFPDLKLWPGVLTIEGLRQSCELLHLLLQLEGCDLLESLSVLESGFRLRQKADDAPYQQIIGAFKTMHRLDPSSLNIRVKLLAPVFAGCVLKYQVQQQQTDVLAYSVQAEIDGKLAAKGEITWRHIAG